MAVVAHARGRKLGGALRIGEAVMVLWGQEKSLSACPAPMPTGVAFPSWRDADGCRLSFLEGFGCTPSPLPPRTRGDPRTRPGSSGVVVVFLVEGVARYVVLQSARSTVGLSVGAAASVFFVFADLPVLAFLSLLFLSFSLGLVVPQPRHA